MYALITGASQGLGKALSKILASNNYNLILVSRNLDLLSRVKLELNDFNVNIDIFCMDLSKPKNCYELFNKIKNYKIDLLINNAGFGNVGYFKDTSLEVELNMINLNIITVQILTKLYLQNNESGLVLNIGSLAGILPTPIHATYSATKSYINSFSRAINYELKKNRKNVRVLTAAPGPVKTNFNKTANSTSNKGMDPDKCARIIYRGISKKKEFIVPGFKMKLVYLFSRFIPTKLLMRLSHKIQSRK